MLRRFRSKRGFTLVEVMVAFVIFAIMAAMVSAILQQTLLAKQENTDLESEITAQENAYYRSKQVKNGEYDSSDNHSMSMEFKDKTGADVSTIPFNYSIGDPNADDAGNTIALEYIQGDLDYSIRNVTDPQPDDPGSNGGSVHSRMNSSIYGSSDISTISMYMVKAPADRSDGKNRYYIAIQASASAYIADFYKSFAKLNFSFPSDISVTGCGKVLVEKTASSDVPFNFPDRPGEKVGFEVTRPNGNTIRLASTIHKDDSAGCMLDPSFGYMGIYVDLSSPLDSYKNNDTADSYDLNKLFGFSDDSKTSNKNENNYYVFKPYVGKTYDSSGKVIEENGTYPNVYAGSPK